MAESSDPVMDNPTQMALPPEVDSGAAQNPGAAVGIDGENKDINAVGGSEESRKKPASSALKKKAKTRDYVPKNCCQKCCGNIMSFFANDAIYGSWVGPHPVSLLCMCQPCRKCINADRYRPLCAASIVTKLMNFLMLGIVVIMSTLFIFPFPMDSDPTWKFFDLERAYPCQGKIVHNSESNGGCTAHAGYFMAYRFFFAFAVVMLTNCFAMADVTSTTDDPYRKRIHHGFWMYKFIFFFIVLLILFFAFNGTTDKLGYFEYTSTIIGNIAHAFFSLMELTLILDIVDIWVVSVYASPDGWGYFLYLVITCVIFIVNIVSLIYIFGNFAFKLTFESLTLEQKAMNYDFIKRHSKTQTVSQATDGLNDTPSFEWPHTNCLSGSYTGVGQREAVLDQTHFWIILLMICVFAVLILVMILKMRLSKRYPLQGWLHVAVIILFGTFYLWSALYNSDHIHSRPRCNWGLRFWKQGKSNIHKSIKDILREGSQDTYFRFTGFFHGLLALFTLLYYAFVHGPRSRVSPMSLAYRYFIAGGNYDRVPVVSGKNDSPAEFNKAVEKLEVWDDEQNNVAQSWSLYYFMMLLGSLSLMMSMTNFTDPWAKERYNSSMPSMAFKLSTAIGVIGTYIFLLICPCPRVYNGYVPVKRIKRVVRKKQILTPDQMEGEGMEDLQLNEGEDDVIIELIEEEDVDEVSLKENDSSTHHQPNQCGCLL